MSEKKQPDKKTPAKTPDQHRKAPYDNDGREKRHTDGVKPPKPGSH